MIENHENNYEIYDNIPSNQTPPVNAEVFDDNYDRNPKIKSHIIQDIGLILLGTIGLYFVNFLITIIALQIYRAQGFSDGAIRTYLEGFEFLSFANLIQYTTLFVLGTLVIYLGKTLIPLLRDFKKFRTYLYGIGFGLLAIFTSIAYNGIIGFIFPDLGSNDNQNAVEAVIKIHPLLSLIWIPFLGPIVEEFTYRFGLFNALNKINRIFAYVVVSLIFGLIHFNFFAPNIAVELLNLPPYIISGLIFSYIYDRENLATSIVAHVTNNFVSYLAMIFYMITQWKTN